MLLYRNFWNTGVPRIGDEFALGIFSVWCSVNFFILGWQKSDYSNRYIEEERDQLIAQVVRINTRENRIQEEHKNFATPKIDVSSIFLKYCYCAICFFPNLMG